jgi:8-oxo-dGTP diphosphatase
LEKKVKMNKVGVFNVAVAVVIEKDDKILITKRSPTRDHAPNEWEAGITGRVDQNETFEQAAFREAKEELGIDIELITPFRTFHFYRGKERVEHQGVNFWAKYTNGEIVLNAEEQVAYKWVDPEEALEYITDLDVVDAVKKFIVFKKHYQL